MALLAVSLRPTAPHKGGRLAKRFFESPTRTRRPYRISVRPSPLWLSGQGGLSCRFAGRCVYNNIIRPGKRAAAYAAAKNPLSHPCESGERNRCSKRRAAKPRPNSNRRAAKPYPNFNRRAAKPHPNFKRRAAKPYPNSKRYGALSCAFAPAPASSFWPVCAACASSEASPVCS